MREIVIYRWIFGLALLLAVFLLWAFRAQDDGFIGLALAFVVAYPFALLVVSLVTAFAMWAFDFALDAWHLLLCVLGLREWD